MKLLNDIARAVRNRKYEKTPEGVYFSSPNMELKGYFDIQVNGGPVERFPNLVTEQWRTRALQILFLGTTPVLEYFLAPYSNNTSPLASWDAAGFASGAGEFTNYDQPTRVQWDVSTVEDFAISNSNNKAIFTVAGGGEDTIWGVGLLTSATKGGTSGFLVAANKSNSSRSGLQEGDEIAIGYTIALNAG